MMSLLLNLLFRFVIACLPRRKHLLISCLQSLSTVILEPKKRKSVTASTLSPSICHEVMGLDGTGSVFSILSFKPAFSLSVKYFCTVMKKYTVWDTIYHLYNKQQCAQAASQSSNSILQIHQYHQRIYYRCPWGLWADPPRNQRTAFYFFRLNCIIFLDV